MTDDRELTLLDAAVQHDAEAQERLEEALERAKRAVRRQKQRDTPTEPLRIPRQAVPA